MRSAEPLDWGYIGELVTFYSLDLHEVGDAY